MIRLKAYSIIYAFFFVVFFFISRINITDVVLCTVNSFVTTSHLKHVLCYNCMLMRWNFGTSERKQCNLGNYF